MPVRPASGEAPPGLAELAALTETEDRRGSHPIYQDVAASDGVTKPEPGALWRRETRTVLGLEGFRDAAEFGLVAYLGGRTLDHQVDTVIECVAAGREDAGRVLRQVPGLAFGGTGAEVQRTVQPDSQQRGDVRASVRTHCRQPVHLGISQVAACLGPAGRDGTGAAERAQLRHRLPLSHVGSLSASL